MNQANAPSSFSVAYCHDGQPTQSSYKESLFWTTQFSSRPATVQRKTVWKHDHGFLFFKNQTLKNLEVEVSQKVKYIELELEAGGRCSYLKQAGNFGCEGRMGIGANSSWELGR